MLVRQLQAPKGFSARLPFGPPTEKSVEEAGQARNMFTGAPADGRLATEHFPSFVELVENQLSGIAGHDDVQSAKHMGRVKGPNIAWKCAIHNNNGASRSPQWCGRGP